MWVCMCSWVHSMCVFVSLFYSVFLFVKCVCVKCEYVFLLSRLCSVPRVYVRMPVCVFVMRVCVVVYFGCVWIFVWICVIMCRCLGVCG